MPIMGVRKSMIIQSKVLYVQLYYNDMEIPHLTQQNSQRAPENDVG